LPSVKELLLSPRKPSVQLSCRLIYLRWWLSLPCSSPLP